MTLLTSLSPGDLANMLHPTLIQVKKFEKSTLFKLHLVHIKDSLNLMVSCKVLPRFPCLLF